MMMERLIVSYYYYIIDSEWAYAPTINFFKYYPDHIFVTSFVTSSHFHQPVLC